MVKITVAIPIYNAGSHLKVTLDSLVNQSMDQKDFEIICVNDCSTDNSKEVIEGYKKTMSQLILIDRTENSGGPMIPRNDAIEAAKGEFILFLDNDDYLGKETLERFYKMATENKSDVIFGKYIGVNGRKVPTSMFKKGNRLNAEILEDNLVFSMAPHKMFRLAFLKENNITFHPKAKVGEDQLFVMQCYIQAKVITVLADYDYYYVVSRGDENLSLKYFPAEDFYFAPNSIMTFIEESNLNPSYKKKVKLAFLHRLFKASRLRKYLFTNILTREQKLEWLEATKRFIENHIGDALIDEIDVSHHYLVHLARTKDLDSLMTVEKKLKSLKSSEIIRVEKGLVYARLNDIPHTEEIIVNHLIKSDVLIEDLSFTKVAFRVKGKMTMDLLKNFNGKFDLILVHRRTGNEQRFISQQTHSPDSFLFLVKYQELLVNPSLVGPWDLFVEASVGEYTNRNRIGAVRLPSVEHPKHIFRVQSLGESYSIRPYFTKPYNNISLDIQLSRSWLSFLIKSLKRKYSI